MQPLYIVQTNDGYYIDGVSYHTTQYGADWACAHAMQAHILEDDHFEADKYQIYIDELES